jgi:isopenicillin-N epimerase
MPSHGRALRHLWHLSADAAFLNHGSFGACPKEVLEEQSRIRERMEREPDAFFRNEIMPREGASALRNAAGAIAQFVHAREPQVVFAENATVAIQAVLRSIALGPGDAVLLTDHTYNAMRLMVEARCRETRAAVVTARIPIPASADEIVDRILGAVTPNVRVALLDHITSPTALVVPLERIVPALRRRGIRVIVDGAHAIGQIALDVPAVGADWYTSNLHKWLYAPKGTAFLWASDEAAPKIRPNVVSHYDAMGFPRAFDYTGTRDNSGWLAAPASLRFFASLDPAGARQYRTRLLERATEIMASFGAKPVAPFAMAGAMRSFILPTRQAPRPQDAADLMRMLWETERVQVGAHVFGEALLLRVSAQVYVDEDDLVRLREALERRGWPGR